MGDAPILYVVIPCYNEEAVLEITAPLFVNKVEELIGKKMISDASKILFVNDGSKDATWTIIERLSQHELICGISQSRNRGHQNAVLSGMMFAKKYADIVITIDCDGQDDINCFEDMVKAYAQGSDVVYGVRKSRDKDTFFKKNTAQLFYKLLNFFGATVVYNHADYRLMSKRAIEALSHFSEVNLFLRGLVPLVGFKSSQVYYDREERFAGDSKYPMSKMFALALEGITSLSIKPIRMVFSLGLILSLFSLGLAGWVLFKYMMGDTVAGWASLSLIIVFFGSLNLLALGIFGEYLGKIYLETKKRPRYIISNFVGFDEDIDLIVDNL